MGKYREVGEQLLPAIAYGDAVGLPHEGQPPHPSGAIKGLEPLKHNPYLGEYPIGTWSDDTQLSLAVTQSLVANGGFDLDDQADMHILALRHSRGDVAMPDWVPAVVTDTGNTSWGGSTTHSVERLMQGVDPAESGEPDGAGNGVLMKLAPLVYWQEAGHTPPDQVVQQITDLTRMTHGAPEAIVSSLVHANMLAHLLDMQVEPEVNLHENLLHLSASYAQHLEQSYEVPSVTSDLLFKLAKVALHDELEPIDILKLVPNHGFYAPETLVMAYGSFVRESRYPQSVYRAVELGGDADSVGSIVATMSTFLYGNVEQPHDYDQLFDVTRLEKISRRLARIALLSR